MGLQMTHNWISYSQSKENTTYWYFYMRPVVGAAWWISDKVSLNLSAGYAFINLKKVDFNGVNTGVSFIFGNAGVKE